MNINEVLFSQLVEPSLEDLEKFLDGSQYVTDLAGYQLFKNTYPKDKLDIYFYKDQDEIIGYTKLVNREHNVGSKFWWLLELWVKDDSAYRRNGLGSALVGYIKDEKGLLILDNKMSPNAYGMIKKMIINGNVQARVLDLKNGNAEDYHSEIDLTTIENQNKTLILEDYEPRGGMLQPMILLNYARLI